MDGELFVAHYSKYGENDSWTFNCYISTTRGVGYRFENQPSSIETNDNKLAYSLVLGVTASNTISVGTAISSLAYTLEGLEMVIGQSLARILGFSISASAAAICTIPFLITSDQNRDYGAGILEPSLPAVRLPVVIPVNISIDIDHALPTGINGNCIVYVIWGPNYRDYSLPPHPIEVAKYGMTCKNNSDERPDTQKRRFNRKHNASTFDYAIIFSNLDEATARLLEYSLIAHYTIFVNYGKLPHKHELPSFVKDRPWDLIGTGNDRVIRARKFIQEQIAKYGK